MTLDLTPRYACVRCGKKRICFGKNQQCSPCRDLGHKQDRFSPYAVAMEEAQRKYGIEKTNASVYTCWNVRSPNPELLEISKFVYVRMAQLAGIDTQSDLTARTIEAQRAAQDRKRDRRRQQRMEANAA